MMLSYPVHLEADDNNTFLATCPDFAEVTTFGDAEDEALARASDALEEAIAARIHHARDIPPPSAGKITVTLPALTAIKAMLYRECESRGLARPNLPDA